MGVQEVQHHQKSLSKRRILFVKIQILLSLKLPMPQASQEYAEKEKLFEKLD